LELRHLTEEEIQTYLDGSSDEIDAEVRRHLETCRPCREVLADYEALYAGLADTSDFEIPRNLAGSVLSGLGLRQSGPRLGIAGDLVLVACGILAMLVGLSVAAGFQPLADALSAFGRPILDTTAPHLESAYSRMAATGQAPIIWVTGIFILVLTGALDLVFKLRRRTVMNRQIR
jgi:hypothetical protein